MANPALGEVIYPLWQAYIFQMRGETTTNSRQTSWVWLAARKQNSFFHTWKFQVFPETNILFVSLEQILHQLIGSLSIYNLLYIPVAPEKMLFQKETSLPTINFQVRTVSFGEDSINATPQKLFRVTQQIRSPKFNEWRCRNWLGGEPLNSHDSRWMQSTLPLKTLLDTWICVTSWAIP